MSAQSPWFLSPSSSSSVTNPISTPVFVGSFCHPIRSNWVRTTLCTIQDEKMNIFDTTNHESPLFYPHYLLNPTLIAMIWWSNPWFAASISIESNCLLNIPPIWCWLISPLFFHFCEKNTVFAPRIWWLDHVGSPLWCCRPPASLPGVSREPKDWTPTVMAPIRDDSNLYHHDCSYSDGSYML